MPRVMPLALLAGATVMGCTATSSGSEAQALLARDREWAQLASSSRSADSIVSYWSDDARVVLPGQPVLAGKAAIRGMVEATMKVPGFRVSWTPDTAIVSQSGDLGYTYGSNAFTAPDSSGNLVTTRGRYLTVWRKDRDGTWRCTEEYSSPAPPTTAAPATATP